MFETSAVWEWATLPARLFRWRSRGWSSGDDRTFHDQLFQSASYDPYSPSYPGHVTIRRFADHAATHLGQVRHAVDLGCGPGEITCELARRFPAVRFTGIDHSAVALARAREHATRLQLANVTFVPGDLESYTPAPGTDIVIMMDAFHHVLDPQRFLARVREACPRVFLIEPAGAWTGGWDRRGDLDWLPATLLQIRERLEAQFGVDARTVIASGGAAPQAHAAGEPTEHRYTLTDFQRFFQGFGVELRGTIAGLERYGSRPYDTSPMRDAVGHLIYDTVVSVENLLFEQGMDLAAKHWAIYAERGGSSQWPEARLRRAALREQPAAGLLPAYAFECGPVDAPATSAPGAAFDAVVRLKNTGWQTWDSQAAAPVLASYHWTDDQGQMRLYDGIRTSLPMTLAQGQHADITVHVIAPPDPGRYQLVLDLVHEGAAWFSDRGCAIPPVVVDVTTAHRA